MARLQRLWRAALVGLAAFWPATTATPHGGEEHHDDSPPMAQYCLDGRDDHGPHFCVATNMYHNHSTSSHDMHFTIETRRPVNETLAGLGWLAIGSGAVMSGSLMLVIYGDPIAEKGPFVSARGVQIGQGHTQPDVLSETDASKNSGVLVQQLSSSWTREKPDGDEEESYIGRIEIACYSCDQWNGHAYSASETSMAMVWAFNEYADMAPFAWDQPLQRHVGVNGFGNFYANLEAATSHHANGPPKIDQTADSINADNAHIMVKKPSFFQKLKSRPAAYIHGFVMAVAFLLLFPAGVVGIRSGLSKAFKYHWSIQAGAMAFATLGASLGIYMSRGNLFGSAHQKIGLAVCALLFAQAASGWWHHVQFVKMQRRTWVSYGHMALGWAILVGGWANAVTGSMLFGVGRLGLFVLIGLIATELLGLATLAYIARAKRRQDQAQAKARATDWRDDEEETFALDDMDSEDEDEDASGRKSDEKLRPAKYHK